MDQDAPAEISNPVPAATEENPEAVATQSEITNEAGSPKAAPIPSIASPMQPSSTTTDTSIVPPGTEPNPADDETMDQMDFEEISDEELEEETKVKGLGDALGVDWASLVAESRPRVKNATEGSAKKRWEPHRVLARIGISIEMAGAKLANEICTQIQQDEAEEGNLKVEDIKTEVKVEKEEKPKLHPIAGMQVSLRDWKAKRKTLFANAGPLKRALCARRDLEIRRYLCKLPAKDTIGLGDAQHPHDPEIFRMALKLYERTL